VSTQETPAARADRAEVLARADAAWQRFQASLAGLTAVDYERPGVEGLWSLKDTLGHMTGWFLRATRCLEGYLDGEPFPTDLKIDQFNAESVALRAKADPVAVLDELREAYGGWVKLVRRIPDDRLTVNLARHWTIRAMIHHFEEHEPAVRRAHDLAQSEN